MRIIKSILALIGGTIISLILLLILSLTAIMILAVQLAEHAGR